MILQMLAQTADPLTSLTQFGAAGLMGGLWWWERRYSRQREDQLTEAHQTLMNEREHLASVLTALQANTKTISDFAAVHAQLVELLRDMHDRMLAKAA